MIEDLHQDITGISFDEFIQFVFAKPVPVNAKREPWYWHIETTFDPTEIVEHYIALFIRPEFLLAKFLKAELEQGFWAIQSCNLDCAVAQLIWLSELPLAVRERCVRSMFHLFEKLFSIEPLETSAHMWWDSLCYDWHCGNRSRANGGEDESMQDVIFETLAKILKLASIRCQRDALHGLGHLHHPGTEELISKYIASHPQISPETKKYALAAAKFQVM
ncbi:MAG TPA: hypothetical protein VLW06_01635 [Terriglobales bacterium]|nr:hypothetical protein [Terriglobales bacterium]